MFPIFLTLFFCAFFMTALVVRTSNSHRLRATPITSDDLRRLSIHYNLMQLYHEFNDLISKASLCEKLSDPLAREVRREVFLELREDLEDLQFKMEDVFKVMRVQVELK